MTKSHYVTVLKSRKTLYLIIMLTLIHIIQRPSNLGIPDHIYYPMCVAGIVVFTFAFLLRVDMRINENNIQFQVLLGLNKYLSLKKSGISIYWSDIDSLVIDDHLKFMYLDGTEKDFMVLKQNKTSKFFLFDQKEIIIDYLIRMSYEYRIYFATKNNKIYFWREADEVGTSAV